MNQMCRTGYSPSGHCGAAYYCSEPYECCAACMKECNMRCGWIPGQRKNSDKEETAMDKEQQYYDISFRRTETGPLGVARRPDMEGVIEWLRNNQGRLNFVLVMAIPGEMPNLPDRESIT